MSFERALFYKEGYERGRAASARRLRTAIACYIARSEIKSGSPCAPSFTEVTWTDMGQEEEPEQRYLDAADEFLKGLQRNENGKPEIPGFAHFSVSHTGDIWAAAFAEVPIGLDVQEKREVRYGAIAEKFYSDAEKDAVVKSGSPKEIFYTIWARKEALVKAAGGKLFMEMPDVVCGDGGEIPPEIEMLGRKWKTEDLIFTDDTAAAVCFEIRGERPI